MRGPKRLASEVVHSSNLDLRDAQQLPNAILRVLKGCPFLVGRLVSVSFSGAGTTVVDHKLGTKARCFPVSLNYSPAATAAAVVRESSDQTLIDASNQMRLISSSAGTVDLWFYPKASKQIPTGADFSP